MDVVIHIINGSVKFLCETTVTINRLATMDTIRYISAHNASVL